MTHARLQWLQCRWTYMSFPGKPRAWILLTLALTRNLFGNVRFDSTSSMVWILYSSGSVNIVKRCVAMGTLLGDIAAVVGTIVRGVISAGYSVTPATGTSSSSAPGSLISDRARMYWPSSTWTLCNSASGAVPSRIAFLSAARRLLGQRAPVSLQEELTSRSPEISDPL